MQRASAFLSRCLRRSLFLSAFLLAAGCGSKGTVSGKVTYKDKAVPGGKVQFKTEKGKSYLGTIKEDGSYTVEKVPAGPVTITVEPNEPPKLGTTPGFRGPPKDRMNFGPPKDAPIPEEARKAFDPRGQSGQKFIKDFPAKYKDPEKSGLTYTVTGGDQTHDIPLK
jgi:hypothetical protein